MSVVTYRDFDGESKLLRVDHGKPWDLTKAYRGKWGPSPWGPLTALSIHQADGGLWLLRGNPLGTADEVYVRLRTEDVGSWLAGAGHDVPDDVRVGPVEESARPADRKQKRAGPPVRRSRRLKAGSVHVSPTGCPPPIPTFRPRLSFCGESRRMIRCPGPGW